MPQEIDPLGIPTVTLKVKHGLTEDEQAREKKKRKTAAAGGSQPRRLLWFEEWEEGEAFRKTSSPVDPMASRVDRLHQACQDFKLSRKQVWSSYGLHVAQLWENFRLYIGIISIKPPISRKRMQEQEEEDSEEDSDDDDNDDNDNDDDDNDDDGNDDDGPSSKPKVEMVDSTEPRERRMHKQREEADERHANLDDAAVERTKIMDGKDSMVEFFLSDPALAMKIFFSAHYRHKGLIWDRVRCRDGPILVEFFLNFILRNRVFPEPEYEKGFRRALDVVKLARKELPLTFTLGKAFPDNISQAFESLMGDMTRGMYWILDDEDADDESDNVWILDDEDADDESDNVDISGVPVGPTPGGWGFLPTGTAGETPGWGTWGDAAPEAAGGDWPVGWSNFYDKPTVVDDWLEAKSPFLMESMGPTALPLTHTTGVVERSTRRILKVVPPTSSSTSADSSARGKKKSTGVFKTHAEAVEEELEKRFGYIVLGPWKKVGDHISSDIQEPRLLPSSRGPVHVSDSGDATASSTAATSATAEPEYAHNPKKDTINVLIHPDTVSKISPGPCMGLNATFVQIARIDPSGDPNAPDQYLSNKNPIMGKGKGRGKGKGGLKCGAEGVNGVPTKFWYMEQFAGCIPSFHTDRFYEQQKTESGVAVKE
ncbi:hypothetical protein K474DRAFT_1668212 [Panus rudis PR-1116 ss-1]|nr:hypothetical protein K474DRAFT_1668212 [Panus rudis PR-1116 ss-1]